MGAYALPLAAPLGNGGGPIPYVDASINTADDAWCVLHNIDPQSRSHAAMLALTLDARYVYSCRPALAADAYARCVCTLNKNALQ